jgi:hypothetical protein
MISAVHSSTAFARSLSCAARSRRRRVPVIENVRRMRQVMLTAGVRYGGDYDGWEAAVQS